MNAQMKKQCLMCEIMTGRSLVANCSGCVDPYACEGLFEAARQGSAASNEPGVSSETREGIKNHRLEWDDPI